MCLFDWTLKVFATFNNLLTFPLNAMMIVVKCVVLSVVCPTICLSVLSSQSVHLVSSLICANFSAICPCTSGGNSGLLFSVPVVVMDMDKYPLFRGRRGGVSKVIAKLIFLVLITYVENQLNNSIISCDF